MECGYRESGISVAKQIMVAVRTSSFGLEMPVAEGRNLLMGHDTLSIIVREANRRISSNFARIDAFLLALKTKFGFPSFKRVESLHSLESSFPRWGHSSVLHPSGLIITIGGTGSPDGIEGKGSRMLPIITLDTNSCLLRPSSHVHIEAVHAVFLYVDTLQCYLLSGGRTSPLCALPCLSLYDINFKSLSFLEVGDIPSPRWGHSLTRLNSSEFLLIGGRDSDQIFSDAYMLSFLQDNQWQWRKLALSSCEEISSLKRFFHVTVSIVHSTDVLVHGGCTSLEGPKCTGTFCIISLMHNTINLLHEKNAIMYIPLFGHSLTYLGAKSYLLLGGTAFQDADDSSARIIDLQYCSTKGYNASLRSCTLECEGVAESVRVHHQAIFDSSSGKLLVLGGGVSCLAFGPYYCPSLCFTPHNEQNHRSGSKEISSPSGGPPAELPQEPASVILVKKPCVKSLKVWLEERGHLRKDKRITDAVEGDMSIIMLFAEDSSAEGMHSKVEQMMAVPITNDFTDLLISDRLTEETKRELGSILQSSSIRIQAQVTCLPQSLLARTVCTQMFEYLCR